jgi:autotransporter-associated beta strand protein
MKQNKSRSNLSLKLMAAMALISCSTAEAATLRGNATGSFSNTGNFSVGAGSGNLLFNSILSGTTTLINDVYTFTGPTAYLVTDIQFQGNSYIIESGTSANGFLLTKTINNLGTNLQTINSNIQFNANIQIGNSGSGNITLGGVISADTTARTLTKAGASTLTLLGSNTYSGSTNITGGTLFLGGTNGANTNSATYSVSGFGSILRLDSTDGVNNNRINDTASITLGQGTILSYQGNNSADSTETVGAILVGAQATGEGAYKSVNVRVDSGATRNATLTASSFAPVVGASTHLVNGINLGKNNSDTSGVAKFKVSTAPTLIGTTDATSSGINVSAKNTKIVNYLVGEATTSTGGAGTATGTANTFLTYNVDTGFRPLNPTDEFTNNSFVSDNNTYITANTNVSGTTSVNSLVLNGGNVTINSGTLSNASGAILFVTSNSISGGTYNGGNNLENKITVNNGVSATISSVITNNGTGGGLTISGGGSLALTGNNTYNGTTRVNEGKLILGNSKALGNSALFLSSGAIETSTDLSGVNSVANEFKFTQSTTVTGANNLTFSGSASGNGIFAGGATLTNNLSNGATLTFSNNLAFNSTGNRGIILAGTGNTVFSGNILIGPRLTHITISNTGVTTFSGTNGYSGNTVLKSGSRLNLASNGALAGYVDLNNVGTDVTLESGSFLDLNNFSVTAASLTFTAGSQITFDLASIGNSAGTALFTLTGNLTKATGTGTLNLELLGGTPAIQVHSLLKTTHYFLPRLFPSHRPT